MRINNFENMYGRKRKDKAGYLAIIVITIIVCLILSIIVMWTTEKHSNKNYPVTYMYT